MIMNKRPHDTESSRGLWIGNFYLSPVCCVCRTLLSLSTNNGPESSKIKERQETERILDCIVTVLVNARHKSEEHDAGYT